MEHCGPIPGSEHYLSFPSVDGSSPRSTPCCGGGGHDPSPGPCPCHAGPRDGTWLDRKEALGIYVLMHVLWKTYFKIKKIKNKTKALQIRCVTKR